jgi:hypothetical protein
LEVGLLFANVLSSMHGEILRTLCPLKGCPGFRAVVIVCSAMMNEISNNSVVDIPFLSTPQ